MGVALVASAAKALTRGTCKDKVAMTTNALAAVAVLLYPATWMFPLVIVLGTPFCFRACFIIWSDCGPAACCKHLKP